MKSFPTQVALLSLLIFQISSGSETPFLKRRKVRPCPTEMKKLAESVFDPTFSGGPIRYLRRPIIENDLYDDLISKMPLASESSEAIDQEELKEGGGAFNYEGFNTFTAPEQSSSIPATGTTEAVPDTASSATVSGYETPTRGINYSKVPTPDSQGSYVKAAKSSVAHAQRLKTVKIENCTYNEDTLLVNHGSPEVDTSSDKKKKKRF